MHDARDAEDIRLLAANDHATLLATYYPVVLERCRLRLPDPDAWEVAQRVALRLLSELRRGKEYPVPFRVVVQMVTTWTIKEFFARPRTDPWPEELDLPAPDPYDDFETDHDLRLLFGDLPERARHVLELRYLEGYDHEEIARRLGIERNAVDQALHRGHIRLRELVGG